MNVYWTRCDRDLHFNSRRRTAIRAAGRNSRQPQLEDLESRQLLTATINLFPILTANAFPFGITSGPDGDLWFAESNSAQIGRITPGGTITEFPAPGSDPTRIAAGPDGNLWFTSELGNQKIGRITPTGTTTFFALPTPFSSPFGITAGPDGALWFTESK
jgi:virginiamycin B lyase